jgi:aldose 1-epimerase
MRRAPLFLALIAGATGLPAAAACTVDKAPYGQLSSGQAVDAWTIHADKMNVTVLSLGGIIKDIEVPDRNGIMGNVVRNLNSLTAYEGRANFSSLVGRYANRISGGGFTLEGRRVDLDKPDAVVSHGGPKSFGSRIWTVTPARCGLDLTLVSPDGDNGFPGEVQVTVRYRVASGRLTLDYSAITTKPTVVALTHHAYFNLSGQDNVYDQTLRINADKYLVTDARRVPTGEILPLEGTPMDLRKGKVIRDVVTSTHPSIIAAKGLDHTFVLKGKGMKPAAVLTDPLSGRRLVVSTTEPSLVVYTAGGFNGSLTGADGRPLGAGAGIALEAQHFPDSPNHPDWPSTELKPGQTLRATTVFAFSAK